MTPALHSEVAGLLFVLDKDINPELATRYIIKAKKKREWDNQTHAQTHDLRPTDGLRDGSWTETSKEREGGQGQAGGVYLIWHYERARRYLTRWDQHARRKQEGVREARCAIEHCIIYLYESRVIVLWC